MIASTDDSMNEIQKDKELTDWQGFIRDDRKQELSTMLTD